MVLENLCMGCMEEKGDKEVCPLCGYQENSSEEPSVFLPSRTILAEKYSIGRVLGQGGFGITYLAWDINLDIKIAVKEFFPQGLVSRGSVSQDVVSFSGDIKKQFEFGLDRFLHEAKTVARFADHPNIVTVRDFFRANGTAYMVMNYVEGMTLDEYLKKEGGKITFEKALRIMMPVIDALKEVHLAGIMHRDISPDNIFIDAMGRVIVIDFGAARQEMQQKSRGLSVILKAGYAPEEQYRTRGEQGPWTDVYAVAATIYKSITGEVPVESMDRMVEDLLVPPSELDVKIELSQEQALLKALAIRAKDRYKTMEEFQEKIVAGETVKDLFDSTSPGEDGAEIDMTPSSYSIGVDKQGLDDKKSTDSSKVSDLPPVEESNPLKRKYFSLIAAVIVGVILISVSGTYYFISMTDEESAGEIEENDILVVEEEGVEEDEEEIVENGDEHDPQFKPPTNYIEALNAEVVRLSFFESGDEIPDWGKRTYRTRFSQDESRFINWELYLKHTPPSEKKYFDITYIYYYYDGTVMGEQNLESFIDRGWPDSERAWNWGWQEPGHWEKGTYYVEIIIDEVVVASGEFEIY